MPPLQEVEQYIDTHGHLEGVPSIAEVEKEGLDVGDMNKVLVKKVDELTLYMIELKKENVAQQVRIEELEKKVAHK